MLGSYDVQAGVFGQNEAKRIEACLESLCTSIGSRRAQITVILNGCSDESPALSRAYAARAPVPIRVCTIAHGDKSNAINQFFYSLRYPARMYVGVDAYATMNKGAIGAMEACLEANSSANGVGTLAGNGRSSPSANAAVLAEGGSIRGQLYALRGEFVERMVAKGLRLPVGLYRGDGLLGAFARHDLVGTADSVAGRVPGTPDATFYIDQLRPWKWRDIQRQWNRMVRQQRGRIENAAIRDIICHHGFEALPDHADAMLTAYLSRSALPPVTTRDRWFMAKAVHGIGRTVPEPDVLQPLCDQRITP